MFDSGRRQFLHTASAVWGGACAASVFGGENGDGPAFAEKPSFEPVGLFLTWQGDPTTTMTVQWVGAEEDAKKRPIWFAKEGSMEWKSQPCTGRRFPMTEQWIFRTELKGLEQGAEYRFRVGLDSAEHKFRTMPAKATNTFSFVSGGDSGVGPAAVHTNQIAAAQEPMFAFLGGDLAYENGVAPTTFLQFLKNYSEHMVDEKKRLIPMLACLGNHEVKGSYGRSRENAPFFYSCFDGLYTDTGFASLDFGDYMSMIFLDTNHTTAIAGEQTSWLEKTLREREDCPNVFVFYHVPAYPSYRPFKLDSGEEGVGAENRKHWVPLFERNNVDAVFEHHDHTFKRTHPLMDGRVDKKNGLVYLGDGSWGKLRRPKTPDQRPYLAVVDEAYHLSLHRIEGDQRFHVALSDKGKVVDVCRTTKRSRMS